MLKRFFPDAFYSSIFDIPFDALQEAGVCGLIVDIDNTLATFDVPDPPEQVVQLLADLRDAGFRVCLFSNNSEKRVTRFNAHLGLPAIYKAGKPKKRGIRRALGLLDTEAEQTALIGDQLFTDIWGANRCGIKSILVEPIAKRDEWTVKLKRKPEQWVMRAYRKRCRP